MCAVMPAEPYVYPRQSGSIVRWSQELQLHNTSPVGETSSRTFSNVSVASPPTVRVTVPVGEKQEGVVFGDQKIMQAGGVIRVRRFYGPDDVEGGIEQGVACRQTTTRGGA